MSLLLEAQETRSAFIKSLIIFRAVGSDTYGLCPWLWTTGISYTGVKDSYDMKSIAIYLRKFEREHNVFLTNEQFDEVYDALMQNWAEGKIFAQRLIPFLKG